jgi:hypothetical protein
VTGPDYGRIWDHELIAAVMKIAGNGTGDTRWKAPGVRTTCRATEAAKAEKILFIRT